MSDISRKNTFLGWNVLELTSNSWRLPLIANICYFYKWRYYTNPYKKCRLNCRRILVSLLKTPFRGFKRPKGVRGTSGRPVNIDFRFLRIFLRIDALIRNWFQGVHATPFFRLDYELSDVIARSIRCKLNSWQRYMIGWIACVRWRKAWKFSSVELCSISRRATLSRARWRALMPAWKV